MKALLLLSTLIMCLVWGGGVFDLKSFLKGSYGPKAIFEGKHDNAAAVNTIAVETKKRPVDKRVEVFNPEEKGETKKRPVEKRGAEIEAFDPEKKAELGRGTWALLHTMGARYPETPSAETQMDHFQFIYLIGRVFPCPECREHFKEMIAKSPPQWLCDIHNLVNERLGKAQFDCYTLDGRWDCGCNV